MLFAPKLFILSLWLTCICGNDLNADNSTDSTQIVSTTPRPLTTRNQTKVTRDDQLLSLLATRRRQIIQSRFKNHLRTIVDLSTSRPNVTRSKHEPIKNASNIHFHLNLSELLHNSVHNGTQILINPNAPSTESNFVNVSSPKETIKRKNVRPNPSQDKENKTRSNMPIIRNILYRRKMSFLNRKLPIDFDQISLDTLGLSEINKNGDLFDSEDSLQVEESSHDKLIYYDSKNNSSKKSVNNFDDVSEEVRNAAFKNKTASKHDSKNTENIKSEEINITTQSIKDDLISSSTVSISTTTKDVFVNETTTVEPRNDMKNLTQTELYRYAQFSSPDVSAEELIPFLHFGDKIPKTKLNQSSLTTKKPEIHNTTIIKPVYENKLPKNLSNTKVILARDFKSKQPNNALNYTHTTLPDKKNIGSNIRTFTRHRGFRNRTLFVQNKRNGQRHTINLTPNITIASLKPLNDNVNNTNITNAMYDTTAVKPLPSNITKSEIKVNNSEGHDKQETQTVVISEATQISPASTAKINKNNNNDKGAINILGGEAIKVTNDTIQVNDGSENVESPDDHSEITTEVTDASEEFSETTTQNTFENRSTIQTLTTSSIPTTRIVSTNVVTSVSIKSPKQNKTASSHDENPAKKTMDEIDARVVATLSNFTSQTFQNHRNNDSINTRNPATMYPNISLDISTRKPFAYRNRTKFILRPNKTQERELLNSSVTTSVLEEDLTTKTLNTVEKQVAITTEIKVSIDTQTTEMLHSTQVQTSTEKNEFKPNLGRQEANAELPIATLFSITEFKKEDTKNQTKNIKISAVETIISRKNEEENIENLNAAYILAALGFLPMSLIVIYVVKNLINRKNKQFEDFETELHDSDKKSIITPVARLPTLVLDSSIKWEFPRSKLRLQTLLGQGNFGQVWKAEADDLKGHVGLTRLVAVKTIKDGAGSKERDELLRELGIMQKMGSHPNVVTLLGCCTDKEPYLLIMEYVMYGKLLTFLRDQRTRRNYYNFSDDAAILTARDLTVFAYCVARGMEYLVSKGIIHRDLAARNILVDHNKLCKIADFGMSRDTLTGEVTEPRQPRNALPVRWMAMESLLYSVFTHKTDVWAFGVLLWEIVTLGSSPYANMSGREVMRLVCAGYRLERPNHCRPELYEVMARTWDTDPNRRPSFAELRTELAAMLENTTAEGSYVDLESFRADSTVYEIDNCTPRGNYFTVKSRYSEFECEI